MLELGAIIGPDGVLSWHQPSGRSVGAIPSTTSDPDGGLWARLKAHDQEGRLVGFDHLHPGRGQVTPSPCDLSTFFAIENGLGRALRWQIVNADSAVAVLSARRCRAEIHEYLHNDREPRYVRFFRAYGESRENYAVMTIRAPEWAEEMRRLGEQSHE